MGPPRADHAGSNRVFSESACKSRISRFSLQLHKNGIDSPWHDARYWSSSSRHGSADWNRGVRK